MTQAELPLAIEAPEPEIDYSFEDELWYDYEGDD